MSRARPETGIRAAASLPVFAALGDATRLELVERLASGGPSSITALSSTCRGSRQAITRHLYVLEKAGIIQGCRRGREHIFQLDPAPLESARAAIEQISRGWDAALLRLTTHLADNVNQE